ncbi:MAG: OB-fold domain-containing protein [Acidobacteriales bacterium]|nr:MAG: OB-fold domain-containing protein [Terriglobales bacterium]
MTENSPGSGRIYTETVVWSPPEAYVNDAPYQIAIVLLDSGGRLTARILGDRVHIGNDVTFAEYRDGVPCFRKSA